MPLHSYIVQLVIFGLAIAVVTDFLQLITGKEKFRSIATWLLVIGTIAAIFAVITGNQAREVVEIPSGVEALVDAHRQSGFITMWIFIALTAIRFVFLKFGLFQKPLKWGYYLLAIIALVFLFRTGTMGAEMVNEHGISVEKMEKQPIKKPGFDE